MRFITILEVFATVVTALGGYEGVKWLVNFFAHRKQEKRLKDAEVDKAEYEVDQSKVATENAMRDMYEETLARMRELDEKRIAEMREDYHARIAELNKANAELHEANMQVHKQNLELLKEGARKDEIIEDQKKKIRELQDLRVEDAKKIGELEKTTQHYKNWFCERETGKGKDQCTRRKPQQNPPLKFIPFADDKK